MSGLAIERLRRDRSGAVRELIAMAHGGWDPRFQSDIEQGARFVLGRAMALIGDRIDCEVRFGRFPVSGVTVLDPNRLGVTPAGGYPVLRDRLQADPSYDAVPLSIGRSSRGASLWDGHRRLETYRAAGRSDFPAWIASFVRGSGVLRVIA